MVAAQDDEGSTIRIEELDRRANLAESMAKRIHDEGMIMREEYQNQVHHLQGLLLQTEDRARQMEHGSEYAQHLAAHLHAEGNELQKNMEHAVMSFRQENQLTLVNNTDLQIINQRTHEELAEYNREIVTLRRYLEMAQRENQNHEEQINLMLRVNIDYVFFAMTPKPRLRGNEDLKLNIWPRLCRRISSWPV